MDEFQDESALSGTPNDLDSFWVPFTPNRQFKKNPRIVVSANGMHYTSHDGRQILDSSSGLWCANLGHCHPKVVSAVQQAIGTLFRRLPDLRLESEEIEYKPQLHLHGLARLPVVW